MKYFITCTVAAMLCLGSVSAVQAQEDVKSENRYSKAKGFYGYGGLAIVKTNFSSVVNLDPNIGFAFGGGYRISEWLAADTDFYWAGRDQGAGVKTRQFGITLNAKFYPMGLFAPDTLDWLQPYVVAGMGGGNFKTKSPFISDVKEGTFIFRIGAGTEVFIVGGLAAYMDLSLNATPGLKGFGFGIGKGGATGVIQFGAIYHF
jgi:opacity protein-like surface antigen